MSPIPARARARAGLTRTSARALSAIAALALMSVGTVPAAHASANGTLEGLVVNETGAPVADVEVWAEDADCPVDETCFPVEGTTDEAGRFSLHDGVVDGAQYSLSFRGYDAEGRWYNVVYPTGQPKTANLPIPAVAGGDDTNVVARTGENALNGVARDTNGALLTGHLSAHHVDASSAEDGSLPPTTDSAQIIDDADFGELGSFQFDALVPGEKYRLYYSGGEDSLVPARWVGGDGTEANAQIFVADSRAANLVLPRLENNEANFPAPNLGATVAADDAVEVDLSSWKVEPIDVQYRWSLNGKQVQGEEYSAYFPKEADAGKKLKVSIVATLADGTQIKRVSNEATIVVLGNVSGNLRIDGDESVGSTLRATFEYYDEVAGTRESIEWGIEDADGEFVAFPGATGDSFTLKPEHEGKSITARISITAPGYREFDTFATTEAISGARVQLTQPTLSGSAVVGHTLTVSAETPGQANATLAYQWLRDDEPIVGATTADYRLTRDDLYTFVSARVTASAPGLLDAVKESDSELVEDSNTGQPKVVTGNVQIKGDIKVGSTVTAETEASDWSPAGVTLSYAWSVDGDVVASTPTFTLRPEDAGKDLSVSVTGSAEGFDSDDSWDGTYRIGLGKQVVPALRVEGAAAVGQTRAARVDAPTGASVSYVWKRAGGIIADATSAVYVPVAADEGQELSVDVTVSAAGYEPLTLAGQGKAKVAKGTLKQSKPTVLGTARVGAALFADRGEWGPDSPSYTYQWFRAGKAIAGATAQLYVPTAADVNNALSVSVKGKLNGYSEATQTSAATAPVAALTLVSTNPEISGSAQVNQTLSARAGTWGPGSVGLSYQWLANGAAIKGATRASYKVAVADLGKKLSVTVKGTQSGYSTLARTSAQTKPVAAATLAAATPTLSGSTVVGGKLTVKAGTWTAGTKLTYQFKRNGKAIAKATGSTYTLVAADRGTKISVEVSGTLAGYAKRVVNSAATRAISAGTITAPKVSVSGTAKVGKTLTAKAGTWKPGGVALKYQWKANGKNIAGATRSTFKLSAKQKKAKISVSVSGSKAGYTTRTVTSAATKAVS